MFLNNLLKEDLHRKICILSNYIELESCDIDTALRLVDEIKEQILDLQNDEKAREQR